MRTAKNKLPLGHHFLSILCYSFPLTLSCRNIFGLSCEKFGINNNFSKNIFRNKCHHSFTQDLFCYQKGVRRKGFCCNGFLSASSPMGKCLQPKSMKRSLCNDNQERTRNYIDSNGFKYSPIRVATGLCKSPYSLDANNVNKDPEEISRSVYKPGDTIYPLVPRAAVAITLCRYRDDSKNKLLYEKIGHLVKDSSHESPEFYEDLDRVLNLNNPEELEMLVIQRGKEPAKYKWSLVGGSVEIGEDSLSSATREVGEETGLPQGNLLFNPFSYTTTDAIFKDEEGEIIFHYVIGQYICLLLGSKEWEENQVKASDDAIDHKWVSFDELPTLDLGSSTMVTTVNSQLRGLFERKVITIESLMEWRARYQEEMQEI